MSLSHRTVVEGRDEIGTSWATICTMQRGLTSGSLYEQFPLDPAKEQIRLLLLHNGYATDDLVGEIWIQNIEDIRNKYYALSYAWGDATDLCPITVSGKQVQITKNLGAALRRLRVPPYERGILLWADALCIDQSNEIEKSQQVAMMGKIYSMCREVYIYLGEYVSLDGSSSLEKPLKLLRSSFRDNAPYLAKHFDETSLAGPPSEYDYLLHVACIFINIALGMDMAMLPPFSWGDRITETRRQYIDRFNHAMEFISSNPWHGRVWTLQEAVLAPSSRIIFGDYSLWMSTFLAATHALRSQPTFNVPSSQTSTYVKIRECLLAFNRLGYLRKLHRSAEPSEEVTLMYLALIEGKRDARYPLDRIYGLIGLVKHWQGQSRMVPNYSRQVLDVYIQATADHIIGRQCLWPLTISAIKGDYHNSLPSWVVDWTAFRNETKHDSSHIHALRTREYNACGSWRPRGGITNMSVLENKYLQLNGVKIGTISAIGDAMFIPNAYEKCVRACVALCRAKGLNSSPYITGEDWVEALVRTMCGDSCLGLTLWRRCSKDEVEVQAHLLKAMMATWADGKPVDFVPPKEETTINFSLPAARSVEMTLHRRRLFVTDQGWMGLARSDVAEGDAIFILAGGPTPFILKPTSSGYAGGKVGTESPPGQLYKLVSECYIHGIMDGEILNETLKISERGPDRFPIETILLE